jgi:hypothetical protein
VRQNFAQFVTSASHSLEWCVSEKAGADERRKPCLRPVGTQNQWSVLSRACRKASTRHLLPLAGFQTFDDTLARKDDESMKPPSNVKTPAQYIASLPADRAQTIATVRALVNKHIPRGYDECLVWGTIGWAIPLSRYPDTYNKQPITYVALSSQKNYCSLYLMGAFWSPKSARAAEGGVQGGGEEARHGEVLRSFRVAGRFAARSDW